MIVKGEKCEFHIDSVSYLGYIVEKGLIRADPVKIKVAEKALSPFEDLIISAPILIQLVTTQQLIMEVDASDFAV